MTTNLAVGLLTGAAWNGANLWCLRRLLAAWLGPRRSTRRAVGWLLVKFPLLYALAFVLLRRGVSLVGFSVGFTLVLAAVIISLALSARRPLASPSVNR